MSALDEKRPIQSVDEPVDVPLKEKPSASNSDARVQTGEDGQSEPQSAEATRRNSLDSQAGASIEQVSPKALEAGFIGVKEKGGVLLVDWDGTDDPGNPLNWSLKKKWIATLIVSTFTFISPVSSSMIAPASQQLASEFGITSTTTLAMATSVFVLGYGASRYIPRYLSHSSPLKYTSSVRPPLPWTSLRTLWPIACPPDIKPLVSRCVTYAYSKFLRLTLTINSVWNTACGGAQNTGQLIAFRFLAGLGGSAPLSVCLVFFPCLLLILFIILLDRRWCSR